MHSVRAATITMILWGFASSAHATRYRVQSLEVPGTRPLDAVGAINDLGQVIGGWQFGSYFQGVIWENGVVVDLGDLPGGGRGTRPRDVNNVGQVVGDSDAEAGSSAFLWDSGVMADLGALEGGNPGSSAQAINSVGQVTGNGSTSQFRTFIWEPSTGMQGLPQLPNGEAFRSAEGINESGVVVGFCVGPGGGFSAVIWQDGQPFDLGRPAGMTSSLARAINNQGQVAGSSRGYHEDFGQIERATLWQNGEIIDVGDLPGGPMFAESYGINEFGQIVGRSAGDAHPNPLGQSAFLWEEGVMYDLNDLIDPRSNWHLYLADDINNIGQIVGHGRAPDGRDRAFLLTPIPEPTTLPLATICVALMSIGYRIHCTRRRSWTIRA